MALRQTKSRRNQNNKSGKGSRAIALFWLVFVIAISIVFFINRDIIKENFSKLKTGLKSPPEIEQTPLETDIIPGVTGPGEEAVIQEKPPARQPEPPKPPDPQVEKPPAPPAPKPPAPEPEPPKPVQTRDRNIYFTQIDKDGQILRSKVTRKIPVSASPMQDALNALLAGPTADELNKGILNLIPQSTRLLSAVVRGSTAYLNFSEDFMFNTFGVEGYAAQLRQIVWTVTEFSTVTDVQILIEGKRMDYLGEGIWIGSPISRQSF